MSLASAFGSSMLQGAGDSLLSYANAWHDWEANNSWTAAFDPGGFAIGKILGKSRKKNIQAQIDAQLQLQTRLAKALPAAQKQGLIDAGFNPILAALNPSAGSAMNVNQGSTIEPSSSKAGDILAHRLGQQESRLMELQGRNLENENELGALVNKQQLAKLSAIEAETAASKANSALSEQEALLRLKFLRDNPDAFIENLKNNLEGDSYRNSRGHQIFEDIKSSIETGVDAWSAYKTGVKLPMPWDNNKGDFQKQPLKGRR